MKNLAIFIIFTLLGFSCSNSDNSATDDNQPTPDPTFYKGMDLSFQSELENYNVIYKDASGTPIQLLDYVANNGTNLVRLKLWHTPQDGQNSLADVKAYAQRIKTKNTHFLLDIHYSDTWADPSHQTPPLAWLTMNN